MTSTQKIATIIKLTIAAGLHITLTAGGIDGGLTQAATCIAIVFVLNAPGRYIRPLGNFFPG